MLLVRAPYNIQPCIQKGSKKFVYMSIFCRKVMLPFPGNFSFQGFKLKGFLDLKVSIFHEYCEGGDGFLSLLITGCIQQISFKAKWFQQHQN